ncbi:hypothetical protein [Halomicrobium urmianum]|uniref:hypothetical protein n=1 Tax=Halomicrobium urmianum TaxID=1586233 RepID=UPI001CD921BB|nr:hypothetical protein [Halomicrobium urmianum]
MRPQYRLSLPGAAVISHRKRNWPFTILIAVGTSVGYVAAVRVYTLLLATDVSSSYPIWRNVGLLLLLAFGTVGVPVALFGRYRLLSPLGLFLGIVLFWHGLVRVTSWTSPAEAVPPFLFVFLLAPLYVAAYGSLAGIERRIRSR